MLAYYPRPTDDIANYQIDFVTDWSSGYVYLAESYKHNGVISGGSMMTYDVKDGEVTPGGYTYIGVQIENGVMTLHEYTPER